MSSSADAPLITFILGGDAADGPKLAGDLAAAHPGASVLQAPDPASWPFRYPLAELPNSPVVVLAGGLEKAAVNHQTANTRLVTTQARYLITEYRFLWRAAPNRQSFFADTNATK